MELSTLKSEINAIVGEENVLVDELMSNHTSFRIGGPADLFVIPRTAPEVRKVLVACDKADVPVHILGRGSNLLVADSGLRGVVVQIAGNLSEINIGEKGFIVADAGVTNSKLAAVACSNSLSGYEFAAGIPGTIGGAAIMNAGAYDGEFKQVASGLVCLTPDRELIGVSAEEARWGYRTSMMQDAGYTVLSVTLQLHEGDQDEIQARMDELAKRRSDKQPLDIPSAGSTFKRPPGQFAGKLIQDAGMQGFRIGGAEVSTKHAGFVVNIGDATASDVRAVIDAVKQRVLQEFGVELEPEVRMWGFEDC